MPFEQHNDNNKLKNTTSVSTILFLEIANCSIQLKHEKSNYTLRGNIFLEITFLQIIRARHTESSSASFFNHLVTSINM